MANILHLLLIVGAIGWVLFLYTIYKMLRNRSEELKMINEIKEELKIVKQELQTLK